MRGWLIPLFAGLGPEVAPSLPVLLVLVLASFSCLPVFGVLNSFCAPHFSLFHERLTVRECSCVRDCARVVVCERMQNRIGA